MYLQSLASAFPKYKFTQKESWEYASRSKHVANLKKRSQGVLEKVMCGNSGIHTRHLALKNPTDLFDLNAGELNQLYEQEAPALAEAALEKALKLSETSSSNVDALLICSCTGYLCPGVTSYVAERMNMRPDVYLQDIVGLGCGAAVPTLRAAHGFLAANPKATVAVIAVESCSSAFFINDDLGVLISLCLFGDGASTSIWRGDAEGTGYRAGNFDTLHLPEEREKIRFVNDNGKLRNKLHRSVPKLAGQAVKQLYSNRTHDTPNVMIHTGGRDVIEAVEETCQLNSITDSREVLKNYGNMSSPSVMVALQHHLESSEPNAENIWLSSFGAGFACHSFELNR